MESSAPSIILSLLIVFAAGKFGGEVFSRLKQPAVIGELLAGVLVGPGLLHWVAPSAVLETVAMMGVVVLMFGVGLETKPSELFKVGKTAFLVGSVGVVVPLIAGWLFGRALGYPGPEAIFIGTALVATSVGITARVLADCGLIGCEEARIVLAAAVIDDVLGMLVLSIVTGAAKGGVNVGHVALVLLQVAAFVGFEVFVAPRLVKRHAHWFDKLHIDNPGLVVAMLVMLGMAAVSETIGLAGIVGAFFAGMVFAESEERWDLATQTKPLYDWLVPYFFVVTGMQVQVAVFLKPEVILPGIALVMIAFVTKVVGGGLGAIALGPRRAFAIGVGMIPRGEVGLIVASAGLAAGIVSDTVYAMVVLVVAASTLLVPPLLAVVFPWATGQKASSKLAPAES
ncbi:MAG TPA: cation:proton antiporter [Coriobacteriia bacterium]|nr:cation:proton antiporter [Coriobacteriia bacterium]